MKRWILSVLLITGLVQMAGGQIPANVRFGFGMAPTFTWLSPNINAASTAGTNVGVQVKTIVEYYMGYNYVLFSGFGMAFRQGGALEYRDGGNILQGVLSDSAYYQLPANSKVNYRIRYIEIPLGFRMRTVEFGHLRYTFQLPVFTLGFKVGARGDIEAPGLPVSKGENLGKSTKFFQFAYGFGAGIEYSLTQDMSLLLNVRYHQGVPDVTREAIDDIKASMNRIEILAAILF